MGPTVCELDGPTPMEKRSKAETYAVTPPGYAAAASSPFTAAGDDGILAGRHRRKGRS
jgi:hypothetical protein